jgi:hypothetical protein
MRILIYEPNGVLEKFLNDYMINIGIIPMVVSEAKMIMPQLKMSSFNIFLSDYSTKEEIITDIIFNMKLDTSLSHIKIFISTPKPERDVLENLIKLGINGFIKKPFLEDDFKVMFQSWMRKNSFPKEKRSHVRITPQPTDNAFANLPAQFHSSKIKFSVIDISVGGIALQPPKQYEKMLKTSFTVGDVIKNVKLRIRHFGINVDIKIIAVLEGRVNFSFVNHDEKSHKYIYRYIADNISK